MITNEEIIAVQRLRREAMEDPCNVGMHERLDLVVERIACAMGRYASAVADYASDEDVSISRANALFKHREDTRSAALSLVREALINRARWGLERPCCTKCEIEQGLGYCRCEIAANE